nr:ABC transporter substrate-binding protein [Enterobacillus tribolii]
MTTALPFAHAADVPAGVKLAAQQTLVINNGSEVASLDPQKVEGVPESNVILNLLEGLVDTDSAGNIRPAVAGSWEDQGAKVWTFHLRDGLRWSNGDPLTAHDFVYSWRRLADPATASPYASYLQYAYVANAEDIIKGKLAPDTLGVKALDDKTLQVTLSQPVPYFISMLWHTSLKPVNQRVVEQFGDKWTQPQHFVGNGPYRLKQWVVNERLVLERNPDYWDNAHTVINQVTFLSIASEVADVNRYRSGEIDITNSAIAPDQFRKIQKEMPDHLKISPYLCTFYYEINNHKPPFDDFRVRAALKMTLERDIIAGKIMGQGQIPAYGFTPPYTHGAGFTEPAWANLTQEIRNQQAKALLAEAGFDEQKPLAFTLLYNTSDQNKRQAIAAASMWQKNLGVKVTLQNQEWKTSLQSRHQGQYDVARATWCGDYNEPSAFLNMMLSDSSSNTAFYHSKTFDDLLAKALQAPNEDERAKLYQQAEQQLDADSAIVPVYYRVSVRLVRPDIGGFSGKDPQDLMVVKDYYRVIR